MPATISNYSSKRSSRCLGAAARLSIFALLPLAIQPARAQAQMVMPTALATMSQIPTADPTVSFGGPAGLRFGPNGQLYVSTGISILEQTGGYAANFTTIGTISTAGSDPGPFNFSQDGQTIFVGNGAGGSDFTGNSSGNLFTLPVPNGNASLTSVPVAAYIGNVQNNADIVAMPAASGIAGSASLFLINVGTNTGSEVDVFNSATGADLPVITGIPGASSSIAIAGGNLYVANGFDFSGMGGTGQIESFSLSRLVTAVSSYSKAPQSPHPLSWGSGTSIAGTGGGNNSGAGIFIDPRGYLFTGGDDGLLVVTPTGQTFSYANSNYGYVSVTYNSITNQFVLGGYDQNFDLLTPIVFSASQFAVTTSLAWSGTNSDGVTKNNAWSSTAGSSNWIDNSSGWTSPYSDGNTAVTFGDSNSSGLVQNTGGVATVTIQQNGVQPAAVMFTNIGVINGGVDYTFCGGPIGGAATIELYGNGTVGGTVNLMNANTFTGPVIVAAGTLNLQNSAALGNSSCVSVIAGASLALQSSGPGMATFGLKASDSSSIPLNLYGTGLTANAGELISVAGNNVYGGAINVGGGGGRMVSASTAPGDQLTLSGGVNISSGATLTVSGPGTTTITGAGLSLGNSSSIQVASGTLDFNLPAGATVSLGTGATTTVASGATLQLAGAVSALDDPASGNRMNVVYQGSTTGGGLTIAGGNQSVGIISGMTTPSGSVSTYGGDIVVAAGASLTADQIFQNTLTIGAGATVTIRPSGTGFNASDVNASEAVAGENSVVVDGSGDNDSVVVQAALISLEIDRLQSRVATLSRLAAANPELDLSLSIAKTTLQSLETNIAANIVPLDARELLSIDANPIDLADLSSATLTAADEFGGVPAAVPEPATSVLLAIAALFLLPALRRMREYSSIRTDTIQTP